MTINDYRAKISAGLTREEADEMFHGIYSDTDLTANEVGEVIGELLRSDSIKNIGEQMKQEWIAKGLTKEQVNASACRK